MTTPHPQDPLRYSVSGDEIKLVWNDSQLTSHMSHSFAGEAFFKHLTAVEDTMRDLGADHDLVNAGLFHSIYGTEGFQAFTVPLSRRPEIRGLIGERAEHICFGMSQVIEYLEILLSGQTR